MSGGARGGFQGRLKFGHIAPVSVRVELYDIPVGDQDTAGGDIGRLQLTAQGGQDDAQAGPPRFGVAIGPEQLDQLRARVSLLGEEGQPCQQGGSPRRGEAGDDPVAALRAQSAEHLELPGGVHIALSSPYLRPILIWGISVNSASAD